MKLQRYITEAKEDLGRWKKYIKEIPMLTSAVSVMKKIESKGFRAYIVGGTVRDVILGVKPKDVDIATDAPIEILDQEFKIFDIGKSKDFGIVVVKAGGFTFEVAQFREDGKYSDGRRPEDIKICQSFEKDASRRDFCFNAMGIDLDGNIIDYFDGKKDIKNKVIRAVGNPSDRFAEDHLRMMRAVRFASKLNFDIEDKTKDAIKKHKDKIKKISIERVKDELFKMANQSGDKFARAITMLDDVGILGIILPEVVKLKGWHHSPTHHPEGDPWEHTIMALKKNKIADPIVNMSILLHDIGKAETYKFLDGKHTFYGHAQRGKELADTIAKRLKLSVKERNAILFGVLNHMKVHKALEMKPSKIFKLVNDENWPVLRAVVYADKASRLHLFDKARYEKTIKYCEEIQKKWGEKTLNRVLKVVSGDRVMELTKLKPSKKVGEIITKVTEWALDTGTKSQKEIDNAIMNVYKGIGL